MIEPDYPDNTVAVFDLDGTVTHRDTYLSILLYSLRFHPAKAMKLVPLTIPAARFAAGQLDNASLKSAFLGAMFAGVPASQLKRISLSFVDRLFAGGLRNQALETLAGHRSAGHRTVLLSASPDFYVEEIAQRLQFDHCICTRAKRAPDNSLTGALEGANCRGEEKLSRLIAHFGHERRRCYFVGYGDSDSDLYLLKALDRGIVVCPDKRTRSKALEAGLQVVDW